MAKVWFGRREGGRWEVAEGRPAYDLPLKDLTFKLDLGWQRRLGPESSPIFDPAAHVEQQRAPTRVFVQVIAADLEGVRFPGYQVGWYDSPYSPAEVQRRLGSRRPGS